MALDLVMTDGVKSVPLDQLPESAWRFIAGGPEGTGDWTPAKAYQIVPILYRAVEMRANAVASMPFALHRGNSETDLSEDPAYEWLTRELKRRLWLTSAAMDVYGRGYWAVERNRYGQNLVLRWLLPTSVTPVMSEADGLVGFKRRLSNGQEVPFDLTEMVYFWAPSLTAEVGPGEGCVSAALRAAGTLAQVDAFAESYFKRGVIKATVFQVDGNVDKGQMEAAQNVLRRMMQGIKQAFSVLVLRSNFKPIVIGDSLKDTSAPEMTQQKREDVAMAMGIPFSLLYSAAANFATAQMDNLSFYQKTVVPRCDMIEEALNDQLLKPLGLTLEFDPDQLDVYQAAQVEQAKAVRGLVGKPILTVNEGRAMLRYDPLAEEGANRITTPVPPAIAANAGQLPAPGQSRPAAGDAAGAGNGEGEPSVMKALLTELRRARAEVEAARKAVEGGDAAA